MILNQFNIKNIRIPRILYKYRDWNKVQHQQILTTNEIYFSSTADFNDPFDCISPFRFNNAKEKDMYNLLKKIYLQNNIPLDENEIEKEAEQLHRNITSDIDYEYKWAEEIENLNKKTLGVFSLSNNKRSILMWSHYSNCHNGFCVGFDMKCLDRYFNTWNSSDPSKKFIITKINYQASFPVEQYFDIRHPFDIYRKIVETKSHAWRYEREYRIILNDVNDEELDLEDRQVKLPSNATEEIVFGANMPSNHKEEIINIIKDW